MKQRPKGSSSNSRQAVHDNENSSGSSTGDHRSTARNVAVEATRSSYTILPLFVLIAYGSWGVYRYQFENLPSPLTLQQAGKRGFSEYEAMKHVRNLTQLGPHPVASHALDKAIKYVVEASEEIKQTAHWEVDVEVELFHATSGINNLVGGLFKGKTLVYSDLYHVVLRISPKYVPEVVENAILVSSHIDTVFSAEGAGDCSSSVAVMIELARGLSQWAHGSKNAVIFLFNTGEEEGLDGAHSFISQHPWSDTIRLAIDLEAMGIGGKSSIFQAGPDPWAIENFAMVAKYPSAQIVNEDIFTSGFIKSATDFQVYKELAGLSGLDFAYADNTAVYHTKNDKIELLKPGSLQHLGENMLAFLIHAAASSSLPKGMEVEPDVKSNRDRAIYFDILGTYIITFRQRAANMFYNSLILQSLMLWVASVVMGGYRAAISLALSCLSVVLMWLCSFIFSSAVAFFLPLVSSSPVPYVSSPWLVAGLFGAPAVLGAFAGQHMGYILLVSYLSRAFSGRKDLPASLQATVAKLDAERWLFKAGLLQWFVLLVVGNYYEIGSSYLALAWLISPAFAYGLLEATLSSARLPRPLKTVTLLMGLFIPILLTSGLVFRLLATVIGMSVRTVRNPGTSPDWLPNIIVAVVIAGVVCLTMVYLLSYSHISGAKVPIIIGLGVIFALSFGAVWGGIVQPFTEDTSRTVNAVHVVDATGIWGEKPELVSYISLFSNTPGSLTNEANLIGEEFVCGRDKYLDLVTFYVNYSCWTDKNTETGWQKSDIPVIHVEKDTKGDIRETQILIDTRVSTRWTLGINTNEIEDFRMEDSDSSEELISLGEKSSTDGWHTIQFAGGRKSPTKFKFSLFWWNNGTQTSRDNGKTETLLLRLRTDVDRLTPPMKSVLDKFPAWCSFFGKSTSPHTLTFLRSLPISI